MFKLNPIVIGICAIPFIAGCSWNRTTEQGTAQVQPVSAVRHGVSGPNDMYQLGRYYQGKGRYDDAAAAYRKALAADPNFVEAHNGLGVIHSMQGNHPLAVTEFNAAIALNPQGAHLYNNLGYAYLVQGADEQAAAAFEKAIALEPGNQRAMNNLETARLNLAKKPQPVQVADAAPGVSVGKASEPGQATPLAEPSPPVQRGVAEANPENSRPASTPEAAKPMGESTRDFRLEVSNGNGVTGMAARYRGMLKDQGVATARLTNQKPFDQQSTQTQYRAGYRAEAAALNAQLPRPGELVESPRLRQDIQVRLVLGKDLVREQSALASELPQRRERPEQSGRKG